jgi:hypothetical protein
MLILIHMSLMIAAVVCFTIGIAAAMFLRKKSYWLKMHKNFNSAINKIAVRAAHRWLGRVSFLLILATLIIGLISAGIF